MGVMLMSAAAIELEKCSVLHRFQTLWRWLGASKLFY